MACVGRWGGKQAYLRLGGDEVMLYNGYDLKDRYRAVGFRFRADSKRCIAECRVYECIVYWLCVCEAGGA